MYEYIWMDEHHAQKISKNEIVSRIQNKKFKYDEFQQRSLISQLENLKTKQILKFGHARIAKVERRYSCILAEDFEQKENLELSKLKQGGFQLDWNVSGYWQLKWISNFKQEKCDFQWMYHNGECVRKQDYFLQDEDWVICWPYEFYVVSDQIWINIEHQFRTRNLDLFQADEMGHYVLPEPIQQEQFEIEPYLENRKTNSSRMASPAGMIVISSLASVLSNWIVNPSQEGMIMTGLVSATISGSAFAGWYRWQAHRRKVLQQKDENELMSDYLAYLRQQVQKVEEIRNKLNNDFLDECEKIKSFNHSMHGCLSQMKWKLPAGIQKSTFGSFKYPNLPWQLAMSNSKKALDQLTSQPLDCWAFSWIEQGGIYDLTTWHIKQVVWLYLLWCWMVETEQRKFVWITKTKFNLFHNGSMFNHRLLCFCEDSDFFALQSQYPQMEWTIFSDQSFAEAKLNEKDTLIYIPDLNESSSVPKIYEKRDDFHIQGNINNQKIVESLFSLNMPPEHLWRKTSYLSKLDDYKQALQMPTCYQQEMKYGHQENKKLNLCVELCPNVYWDLKKEGPHALIAGATGSGKSEGLCSILYQLALQNSSLSLQYVLIDFKGGSFLSPFIDLPHTAAVLTNLDVQAIWRLEQALNQELNRRQDAISQYLKLHPGSQTEIESVNDPQTKQAFSEIIVVVDEFGELKSRCPEFMKSLQQMARIGRSLGFHLILSTQKPAGIVDEQIWANAKSRLCFPVLDRMDSREVLGHEQAAMLKVSGEFILQTDESEKTGRMFYLKRPFDGSSKIEVLDFKNHWQIVEQKTIQDAMRALILKRNECKRWLLIPDLMDEPNVFSGLQEDFLNHFSPYCLPSHQMHLCVASEQQIEQLFGILFFESKLPVLTNIDLIQAIHHAKFDTSLNGKTKDQLISLDEIGLKHLGLWQKLNLSTLWQLSTLDHEVLVLIGMNEQIPFELIEVLSQNRYLTIILAFDHISFRQEKLFRFCNNRIIGEVESRDQLSLISEGKLTATQKSPLLRILEPNAQKEQYKRVIMGNQLPNFHNKRDASLFCRIFEPIVMELDPNQSNINWAKGLIGIEISSHQPHFKGSKPIVICWQQRSAKDLALILIERLNFENSQTSFGIYPEQAQFVLCDLTQVEDPAKVLSQTLELADVLFVGDGLSNYSYAINLPYRKNSNAQAIYICQGQVFELQLAKFIKEDAEVDEIE